MRTALVTFAALATATLAAAQAPLAPVVLDGPSGTYPITIDLPPGYDAAAPTPYPVLYVLDAWWLREMTVGIATVATIAHKADTEPVVVVGIGFEGDEAAWTVQRNRDLTPAPYRSPVPGVTMAFDGVVLDSAGTGGAAVFLAFLERDVFPAVEARVHTSSGRRGLLGHSFGGLFGAWALQSRPDLFERMLLVSPSTWWRGQEMLAGGFAGAQGRHVYVAVGDAESGLLVSGVEGLEAALRASGVEVTAQRYPDATHTSVLPRAIWDGVEALYGE